MTLWKKENNLSIFHPYKTYKVNKNKIIKKFNKFSIYFQVIIHLPKNPSFYSPLVDLFKNILKKLEIQYETVYSNYDENFLGILPNV